jgi:hypothetical protein
MSKFFIEIQVNKKPIILNNKIELTANVVNTPESKNDSLVPNLITQPINKNTKLTIYMQHIKSRGLILHVLHTNPSSISGEDLVSKYGYYIDSKFHHSFHNTDVNILSPSINKLKNFKLSRLIVSDSLGAQALELVKSKTSLLAPKCHRDCLLGGMYMSDEKFEERRKTFDLKQNLDPQICWACKGDMVYNPVINLCQEFCDRNMLNVYGNCVPCQSQGCLDNREKMTFKAEMEKKSNRIKVTPSQPFLKFYNGIYKDNFDLYESRSGDPFNKIDFDVENIENSNEAYLILKKASPGINKILNNKKNQQS